MAKTKRNNNFKPTIFARIAKKVKRFFDAKNIVVVSENAVGHYAVSIKQQCTIILAMLGVVALTSFYVGRYIQATEKIEKQEEIIETAEEQNQKIYNDFSLLKRDLIKISKSGNDMEGYAQLLVDQYEDANAGFASGTNGNNESLMKRIDFLEDQLQQSELKRSEFVGDIYLLTKQKVRALHKAIYKTGMEDKLSKILDSRMQKILYADNEQLPQGGIYQPIDDFDDIQLTEQQTLNEVVYLTELVSLIEELPIRYPVTSGKRSSGFGTRVDPFRGVLAKHNGVDFSSPYGTNIKATAAGRVRFAGKLGGYGNNVDIYHGKGISTRYSHLSEINVEIGQKIKAGDVIGVQGTTGRSTGHHLHYEVRHNNIPINPDKFLSVGKYVSKILK
jgi:murein DD-endopeptidase MepM/ murein hydrolase activator NlpD